MDNDWHERDGQSLCQSGVVARTGTIDFPFDLAGSPFSAAQPYLGSSQRLRPTCIPLPAARRSLRTPLDVNVSIDNRLGSHWVAEQYGCRMKWEYRARYRGPPSSHAGGYHQHSGLGASASPPKSLSRAKITPSPTSSKAPSDTDTRTPPKRGRGRPQKVLPVDEVFASAKLSKVARKESNLLTPKHPVGRPIKYPVPTDNIPSAPKRMVGRPRKLELNKATGSRKSLELWNMVENKSMIDPAHDGLIAALAQSLATSMVASASHDKCVKLWA
ncbi:unnamed protein product [Calypogeia fissa]